MLGAPVQIAYAVDDVLEAAQRWVARGVGPFFVREHIELNDVLVRGVPSTFDHSSAYAQWGPLMVELICQHDGGTEPIVPTTGVHHLAHFVDDFARASLALIAQGTPEVLFAATSGGVTFGFYDAGAVHGHLIEIYEHSRQLDMFYAMVREASIDWNGNDPIRRL